MTTRLSGSGDGLGINGLGRIGKLTLWHHVARRHFPHVVVNVGREVGRGLEAACAVVERDSTYGSIHRFLFGVDAAPCVKIADRDLGLLDIAGTPVTVLREHRDPRDLDWKRHGVRVVVDATGSFNDPTAPPDRPGGSLRGHLAAGADTVLHSAAFKSPDEAPAVPDDAVTLVYGINHERFDPSRHRLISAASCTTTAVAHMLKPIFDYIDPATVMTASMSTVHAATNTQSLLDSVPSAGARDLRKSRSALNSIILTSTNAAEALERVLPEIRTIGFMADSVRVPVPTESLAILNVTFQSTITRQEQSSVDRSALNEIYRAAADGTQRGLLVFSDDQNVPADVAGMRAAVVIEGAETHTRTGFVRLDLSWLGHNELGPESVVEVPVTHAKIFGWYDNEYGSYTNLLGDLTVHVHASLD